MDGGELFERVINDDFVLTERACTVFVRQICEGVEFIHSKNILHLDMKVSNGGVRGGWQGYRGDKGVEGADGRCTGGHMGLEGVQGEIGAGRDC